MLEYVQKNKEIIRLPKLRKSRQPGAAHFRLLIFEDTFISLHLSLCGRTCTSHICSSPLSFLFLVVKFKIYMPRLVEQFREKKTAFEENEGNRKDKKSLLSNADHSLVTRTTEDDFKSKNTEIALKSQDI